MFPGTSAEWSCVSPDGERAVRVPGCADFVTHRAGSGRVRADSVTGSFLARSVPMSETATAALRPAMTRSGPLDVEALWRTCADDLYAYACTVVRDPALAEEVVAMTFERALTRRARFDRRRGEPRAWLFGIARNAAVDELRRRGRRAALAHDPIDDATPDPADELAERDEASRRRDAVARAIAALPGTERELVALKFHAGLTNAEIAAVLGISTTNAGSRLHRVLTHLREVCRVAV